MLSTFSRFAQDAVYPYGSGGANASFALITKHYMNSYGAKREDFAKICIAQRDNAMSIPHAIMKKKLTLDEYMSARPIADPIHLFDCVMPCAGAEAFVVCREDVAKSLNLPSIRILSTIERHNAFPNDPVQIRGGWELDIGELWSMAALTPKDVDFVQTYDDYPVISMMQFEDLGFCPKGAGPDFVRSHTLTNDGTFPHNTSGGQLSVGQAGAAGGFLGLVEAMRQLTSQPLGSQVPNANACLVSGFGMINYDRGLVAGRRAGSYRVAVRGLGHPGGQRVPRGRREPAPAGALRRRGAGPGGRGRGGIRGDPGCVPGAGRLDHR
jgi:acetyl-CoA acetyltransferase